MREREPIDFTKMPVPIICQECGNDGTNEALWESNSPSPFRITERVTRTWPIEAVQKADEGYALVCEGGSDEIDWESSSETTIECCACFSEFPVPAPYSVDWE